MKTTATIRGEVLKYLQDNELTLNQFARISGVNTGSLSSILNGNRPMSMNQLDRITAAIGYNEGIFYDRYIFECIFHTTPDWRRLRAFLQRCAEVGKLDCLQKAARLTMENINYGQMLFDLAEDLFNEERYKAAAILYETVAESEKFQHSDRLALCHYRLFLHSLDDDQESNWHAVVLFEPYIERLDEGVQLDAYVKLINVNGSLGQWNKVDYLAEKMGSKAIIRYQNKDNYWNLDQPLIFYILYSYLCRETSSGERGDFEQALYYTTLYENMDWIIDPTEDERKIMYQFKEWAEANRYLFKLLSGKSEVLLQYVEYVESREDEIFVALCNIVLAANRFKLNVDNIINKFKAYLDYRPQKNQISEVSKHVTMNQYTRFIAELGIYYLNSKQFDRGLTYIVDSLEYSVKIKSDRGMLRCMGIFEQFRHLSSEDTQKRYAQLIQNVQKLSVYAWSPLV